ncbi:MAG TPA: hypothetical protein VG899_12830 [Mycobacteriales bacterium]|nr:hypothetical protein [Mycobacteriales bacterium]
MTIDKLLLLLAITWCLGYLAGGYVQFWRRGGTHELLLESIRLGRQVWDSTAELDEARAARDALHKVVAGQSDELDALRASLANITVVSKPASGGNTGATVHHLPVAEGSAK